MIQGDSSAVWEKCLRSIRGQVGEQSFKTWFMPVKALRLQGNTLTLQVPSHFFYEWLEEHYVNILKESIENQLGPDAKLEYSVVVDNGNDKRRPMSVSIPNKKIKPGTAKRPEQKQTEPPVNPFKIKKVSNDFVSNLNERYDFGNLIEGNCNSLAYKAGRSICDNPGFTSFNPFMIFGGVGLGKTHLAQAAGNEIRQRYPEKAVLYAQSERFITQFIESLKANRIQDFTNYYLQTDVLILDDIQFLAGKERTQESFFHIFNHLHQAGKQIILTSDRAPKDIQGLEDRLLSRFKWGLTAQVTVPDFETRLKIVRDKTAREGIKLPGDTEVFIARNVNSNIRELEGVLVSLIAKASLMQSEITIELVADTLDQIVSRPREAANPDLIRDTVSEYFNIRSEELSSKTRKREIASARQVAMYFCHKYSGLSLKNIGNYFGKRDHSAVSHASKKVSEKAKSDSTFRRSLESLRTQMNLAG